MFFGDYRPDGRHARPVAGIAYGLSSGLPIGAAELAIKGWSNTRGAGLQILQTPYPYVTVLAATVGFGIMQAAFQRSRVSIVAAVMTIGAKTYLLLVGGLLYGEPWPDGNARVALRIGGLTVGLAAVLLLPRHEIPRPRSSRATRGQVFGGRDSMASALPYPRGHRHRPAAFDRGAYGTFEPSDGYMNTSWARQRPD
jgi:hypothetical protein